MSAPSSSFRAELTPEVLNARGASGFTDASVMVEGSAKAIALFRCTQMVLWPKQGDKVAKDAPA
jgi:hypothetical protein